MIANHPVTGFAATAALLAIAAASVPVTASAAAKGDAKLVACYGINSCKGQSDCKSGSHECKGQNACKGQGFKEVTVKQCTSAGGSPTAPAA
ncbi:hypothetical protein [Xanthomonas medicagonis]|uniref:BufA2 family periplasmic bufferin-type metallophore n=1 Tax=Xanthomonas medicagonis TaxID=3160841 RepID=UPI0035170764